MSSYVKDKNAKPIEKEDSMWNRIRGGQHKGVVDEIVATEEAVKAKGVKHLLKVLFEDQYGHNVAHNPETLQYAKD